MLVWVTESMKVLIATLTILYTIFMVAVTVGLTINYSLFTTPDVASSMVVLTGHRTRDWTAPNSYSMHPLNEDHHTRLYSCMQQAGITKVGTREFKTTVDGFRRDAKDFYNCGLESDRGWPRDFGFLRCLQKHFSVDYHQSNLFLQCLDLSEGFMVESIQARNSMFFMGSYNFVALLVASSAVITAFLMFTAGGAWTYYESGKGEEKVNEGIEITRFGHLGGYWLPLSAFNTNAALVWSILIMFASLWYTFPMNNTWSDIPAVEGGHAFPTTPWGGYLCTLVFLSMTAFFFSYFMEWAFDSTERHVVKSVVIPASQANSLQGSRVQSFSYQQSGLPTPAGVVDNQEYGAPSAYVVGRPPSMSLPNTPMNAGSIVFNGVRTNSIQPQVFQPTMYGSGSSVVSEPQVFKPRMYDSGSSVVPTDMNLVKSTDWSANSSAASNASTVGSFSTRTRFINPTVRRHLGILADTHAYLGHESTNPKYRILPFINKAFACTWILADSLLFVGMLNSQNSLLTENVAMVCYYIFLCRAFQFTAALFMDRVIFEPEHVTAEVVDPAQHSPEFPYTQQVFDNSDNKQHQPNIVACCCQLCSLWCYTAVMLHFLNSFSLAFYINNLGIGNQTYGLQLSFVILMTVLEVGRHLLLFWSALWRITPERYMDLTRIIFLLDCVIRTVFILSASKVISDHLGEQNSVLYSYLQQKTG
jgi:hypothetical protein